MKEFIGLRCPPANEFVNEVSFMFVFDRASGSHVPMETLVRSLIAECIHSLRCWLVWLRVRQFGQIDMATQKPACPYINLEITRWIWAKIALFFEHTRRA